MVWIKSQGETYKIQKVGWNRNPMKSENEEKLELTHLMLKKLLHKMCI